MDIVASKARFAKLRAKQLPVARHNERISISGKQLPLTPDVVEFKVGLFRSRGRLGRAAQAVGTAALPGNTSKIRRPIRSTVASALTPGSPGVGRRIGRVEKFRCPAGFENGGRFTGRNFEGCGQHLFGAAAGFAVRAGRRAGQSTDGSPGTPLNFDTSIANVGEAGSGRLLSGGRLRGRAVQIARNVGIPRIGSANGSRRNASVLKAAGLVRSNPDRKYFIRRDGIALQPEVSVADLSKIRSNPDMDGGTLVLPGLKRSFNAAEAFNFLSTPANSVVFALPGGKTVEINKNRTPSADALRSAIAAGNNMPGADSLTAIAEASNGAFTVKHSDGEGVIKTVTVRPADGGASRTVPLWVYNTYLKAGAPGNDSSAWEIVRD